MTTMCEDREVQELSLFVHLQHKLCEQNEESMGSDQVFEIISLELILEINPNIIC